MDPSSSSFQENAESGTGNQYTERLNRKRKRKNGFFARAKKFGKQGKLGRGYEIDSETYSYFLNVLELCQKNEFENDEEREMFIENAFTQTENEEINLACNQLTSRVLEKLLSETKNSENLKKFAEQFTPSLRTICTDPFASHVLERLLYLISTKWNLDKWLMKWFKNTCQYVLNNFEEFLFNNFANRVMRRVCQCLTGSAELFDTTPQKNSNQFQNSSNKFLIPSLGDLIALRKMGDLENETVKKNRKKCIKIAKKFGEQFFGWPQVNDLFQKDVTSGFVQCLIVTLAAIHQEVVSDAILHIINAINDDFDFNILPQLFTLEACVAVSADNETIFKVLYVKYFQGKVAKFALHSSGHFTLERFLSSLDDSILLEEIFTGLESQFNAIYKVGHFSVFNALSSACVRLKIKQSMFVDKLATLLDDVSAADENGNKNFAEILSRFGKPVQKKEDGSSHYQTEYHGCVVLQNLLLFHKPFKAVSSILDMNGLSLKRLAEDPKGSHVIDSFVKSTTISDKHKDKLIFKLKEHFVSMACSRFGSRSIDAIWEIASLKNKGIIAGILSERESQLNANTFGKFISAKCGLSLHKRNDKEWAEVMTSEKKKEKLAQTILADLGLEKRPVVPAKRQKLESNSN